MTSPVSWILPYLVSFLMFMASTAGHCSKVERGYPRVTIYTNEEIDAHSGGGIGSDADGRILYSSSGELMAFDGIEWRRISRPGIHPLQEFVSLATAPDGTIYSGGLSNWGKLTYDENGHCYLESFADDREAFAESFGAESFNDVEIIGEDVYFFGYATLIRWNHYSGNRVWKIERQLERFVSYFSFQGKIYLVEPDKGLKYLNGDSLEYLPASETLVEGGSTLLANFPWFDGRHAFLNDELGIILFDGKTYERFETELDELLLGSFGRIADFQLIGDNLLAISLKGEGIVFSDPDGMVISRFDERIDYRALGCGDMELSDDGSLWVVVSNGVAKVLNPGQISFIDSSFGLDLDSYDLESHRGDLIIASKKMTYRGQYDENGILSEFETIGEELERPASQVISLEDGLLFACGTSLVVQWDNGAFDTVYQNIGADRIIRSKADSSLFVVSGGTSLQVVKRIGRSFQPVGDKLEIGLIDKMIEDAAGRIWMERGVQNIAKLEILGDSPRVRFFGREDGLPQLWIPLWDFNGTTCISAAESILRYDEKTDSLVHFEEVEDIIPDDIKMVTRPALDSEGNLWVAALDGNLIMRKGEDGIYQEDRMSLQMLKNYVIDTIEFEKNEVAWLLSRNRLVRIDLRVTNSNGPVPLPRVNEMRSEKSNMLLYHPSVSSKQKYPVIDCENNDVVIRFSTPYYASMKDVYHRYKLEGLTSEWSDLEHVSQTKFTNLHGGEYIFYIQAENESGEKSPIASFPFRIKKPIYKTIPAFLAYVAVFVFLVLGINQLRLKQLLQRQKQLRHQIGDQTAELEAKNEAMRRSVQIERDLKLKAESALRESAELNTAKSRLENEMIKRSIQPHFLMNTLNALAAWVEEDPEKGIEFINELSNHFDILLRISGEMQIPIRSELDICRSLLAIMSYRKEIDFKLRVEGIEKCDMIPPCILHTIVENGVTHNDYKTGEVVFKIRGELAEGGRIYTIDIPLVSTLGDDLRKPRGTGLRYVEARLKESYCDNWSLISGPHGPNWRTVIKVYAERTQRSLS